MIIVIKPLKPSGQILTLRTAGFFNRTADVVAAAVVAWRGVFTETAPGIDFMVGTLEWSAGLDPCEQGTVAKAFRDLGLQRFRIDAGEGEESLIKGTGIVVFTVFPGERGAALVEDARQDDKAAKANAGAARRTLGEVGVVHMRTTWRGIMRMQMRRFPDIQ